MTWEEPRIIRRRHFHGLWRVLDGRRFFVYGWAQAHWLRRLVGQGFVEFFWALRGGRPNG